MSRKNWVNDIIRFTDNPWYIHKKNENERYDIFDPADSELFQSLV